MQFARLVQAVIVMLIVVSAASCAVTKQYSSKLFTPRVPAQKDSQAQALRFLEIESNDKNTDDWVTTDIITGGDTVSTVSLDNLAKTFPSTSTKDAALIKKPGKEKDPVITESKTGKTTEEPVAKTTGHNGVRSKKTREE